MMDHELADAVNALVAGLQEERRTNSVDLAAATILVFDWLLLLNTEYEFIWKTEWKLSKALYILVRYLPFFDTLLVLLRHHLFTMPAPVCQGIFRVVVFSTAIGVWSSELILTLRTWAIMGKGKKLGWTIASFYASMSIVTSTIVIVYGFKVKQDASPVPRLIGCTLTSSYRLLSAVYIFLMIYDGVLLAAMTTRAISAFRSQGISELVRVVYRDGITYYVCLFVLCLLNVLVILFFPRGYEILLLVLERVMHSIVACRVMLHIRMLGTRQGIPVELVPLDSSSAPWGDN